jgi:hypothetical protein
MEIEPLASNIFVCGGHLRCDMVASLHAPNYVPLQFLKDRLRLVTLSVSDCEELHDFASLEEGARHSSGGRAVVRALLDLKDHME